MSSAPSVWTPTNDSCSAITGRCSLQPKAFETLLVLVRHSETVVLKDDLMKSVWPDTFVEESRTGVVSHREV